MDGVGWLVCVCCFFRYLVERGGREWFVFSFSFSFIYFVRLFAKTMVKRGKKGFRLCS